MIFSDLDGSLHDPQQGFHPQDLHTLAQLPQQNILRVIATGRSLYSAQQVLSQDFPIDYLIFSSGAGILHWPTQRLIYQAHLDPADVQHLLGFFEARQLDFFLHGEVPDNHRFWCHRFSARNDYNDTDLLAWADAGYVVRSAPESLKAHHTEVSDPHQAGFSEAFARWQAQFLQDHPAL